MNKRKNTVFPSALEDAQAAELCVPSAQTLSPSYRLAYKDLDFLLRDELRPVRLQSNEYITPELCFQFHYFAIRKMHFLIRAKALVVFPGGFGTLDELFETLTLIQTKKIKPIPVIMFGRKFWERVINFEALVVEGTISPEDIHLFQYVEKAEEAWEIILRSLGEK